MPAPTFIYGTAWKEDDTARCVRDALAAGFRAIDTANQRKHYCEAAVGNALRAAWEGGQLTRDDLWLQTKYTFQRGQDERLPYDPRASLTEQVQQSFASSLEHLGVERLDSYLLHGPSTRPGLADADWEVWAAIEALHRRGQTAAIGVSNVSLAQLELLVGRARVKPRYVQNRCYARTGWDRDVRRFCRDHGIVYQGFSLLTANRKLLAHPPFRAIVARKGRTTAQVVFRFAQAVGILPLTGTTDPQHMREDLDLAFDLAPEDIAAIETMAVES